MCGITGVYAYGASRLDLDEPLLGRMTDSMEHRGPDGRGLHLDPSARVGLGHRRLSIIDLSDAGHQPMRNDDGSLWIVYNGEIYNHEKIRAELESKGIRFRSRCDTEVILRLYEAVGDDCVHQLLGMFAFAIWDGRRNRLFAARDRIGIKPLYWAERDGHFFFASEIRALLEHPRLPRAMNPESLYHNLTFLSTPAPETMFEGVHKLRAGHRMSVDSSGVRIQRWWDAMDAPRLAAADFADEDEVVATIREKLLTAIRDRMMSDVPFGVFLSGGIDSSANVALMSQCTPLPVETFTVGFEGRGTEALNELGHARRIAERYRTNHHEVVIDHQSVLDYLPRLIDQQDEPNLDPVCVPLYYVSKLARDNGIKVIQVGEGSDEMFLGYAGYMQSIRFAERLRGFSRLPAGLRSGIHALLSPGMRLIGHRVGLVWEELLRRAAHEDVFWGGAIQLGDREKAALFAKRFVHRSSWSVIEGAYREIDRRWPDADIAQRMSYLELRQRLPELLLARCDKITMAVSIEGRVPFLDHRLVEYVLRLPMAMKIRGERTKALLKRAVADLLPDDLLNRRKQGFPAPMSSWMFEGDFGQRVRAVLSASPLVREGWLARGVVDGYAEEHFARRRDRGSLLWTLFNLSLWHRRWIEGEPPSF